MRFGTDDYFLTIADLDETDPYAPFRVEARMERNGALFHALNPAVFFGVADSFKNELDEFADLKRDELEIAMTEGCGLTLRRDLHGNIDVVFKISYWRLGNHTFLSGDVSVPGEYSQGFLRELKQIIFSK